MNRKYTATTTGWSYSVRLSLVRDGSLELCFLSRDRRLSTSSEIQSKVFGTQTQLVEGDPTRDVKP